MKIIDLDKVRWTEGFYDMHTGEQYAPMMFNTKECLEWATAEAEVKAIPIEWILNHPKFPHKNEDRKKCILDMIADWEKENETN